jgi:dual specificity phosphatase 12
MKIEVEDNEEENILFNFDSIYNFIEEGRESGAVLIHCYGGISRSATISIAYLIKKEKIPFEKAFEILKGLKEDINPNEGFINQLKLFDSQVNRVIENTYKCRYFLYFRKLTK